MSHLKWITDKNLNSAVFNLWVQVQIAENMALSNFNRHFVDPFIGITEMNVLSMEYDFWKRIEVSKSIQKDMVKNIYHFFLQIILTCNESDFIYSKVDKVLSSNKNRIVACLNYKFKKSLKKKNKKRYKAVCGALYRSAKNQDYTGIFIVMIPNKPVRFDVKFKPDKNLSEINDPNERVRFMDIVSFFHNITHDENAFRDLFNILPKLFAKYSEGKLMSKEHDKLIRAFYYTYG